MSGEPQTPSVVRLYDLEDSTLQSVLERFGLKLHTVAPHKQIPGSFWGDDEAGLIADEVFVRADTPLHSTLHESAHYVCMTPQRRHALHTDAGGDYDEENAVCYLQILLADEFPGIGRVRMFQDMDAWGYSFRLGSAQAWFERDAEDARSALVDWGVVDRHGRQTWRVRA